ncbi:MAG: PmoA family protein [Pirellulaceae bacterium]
MPLPNHQASFQIDGVEATGWHFGTDHPRPFFYPLNGPSGTSLTRMGHPGAANHDHHLSVWFAHHDVDGFTFWADGKGTSIRQKQWYAYEDGDAESIMACQLGWYDPDGNERMRQDLVACVIPGEGGQFALELQSDFRPASGREAVRIGQTNFGFLAVRVAKTLSVHFGGGMLTSSEGTQGEPDIFGKPARWMDYSGPVARGTGDNRTAIIEGITYFDHPSNPRYPTSWHVRSDGWMGASFAMHEGLEVTNEQPLRLRYLLQVHAGGYSQTECEAIHRAFADRKAFEIEKGGRSHTQFTVSRAEE